MTREKSPKSDLEQLAISSMEKLRLNTYPGRGIVMGFNKQGDQAIQIYWVMGRSENSRNRILVQEGNVVKTKPFDASKVKDPTLIIYTAMKEVRGGHLVSNGDQTDSIAQIIEKGGTFGEGLRERTYEPDAPNFTPRITGEYSSESESPFFILSIIRKDPFSDRPIHNLQLYKPESGTGKCIHTYEGDGNPLPSFKLDPYLVTLEGSIDQIAQTFWDLLNAENRVALAVKGVDIRTGKVDSKIINQLGNK